MKNLWINHKNRFDHYGSVGDRISAKKKALNKLNSSVLSPKELYEPIFPDIGNTETDVHYQSFL